MVCVNGGRAGVDSAWEQDSALGYEKMPESTAESSHTSGARFC